MRSPDPPAILVITGVSGSGKTTVATALAQRLRWPLQEGDELDQPVLAKIHSAHPLDARDQWSWLTKVAAWIDDCRRLGTGGVITCSVLRRSYRDFLTRGRPEARIVYLHGERPLIEKRLAARKEHSMVPDILDHHFAILEEPERLLSLRNDVGLLAEEYDPRARRQTGNFPQAFSHLALIMSALSLHDVGTAQQRGQREEARLVNPA